MRVVFRTVSVEIDPDTNMPVKLQNPVLNVESSQLPQNGPPVRGDRFTVGGVKYQVEEPPSDEGEGTWRVVLRRAKA